MTHDHPGNDFTDPTHSTHSIGSTAPTGPIAGHSDFTDSGKNSGNGGTGSTGGNQNGGDPFADIAQQMMAAAALAGQGHGGGGDRDDEIRESFEEIAINYNEKYRNALPILHRDRAIDQLMAILISHDKPNGILVGEAGVGKTAIAEDLARRIANRDVSVPDWLADKTIWEIPLAAIKAGTKFSGQLEEKLLAIIEYLTNPDNKAIAFIDEIHVIANRDSGSSIDEQIAQILKPALSRSDLHLIGATTTQESRNFDADPALKRRFTRVTVSELSCEATAEIMRLRAPKLTAHYGDTVGVDDAVIDRIIEIADEEMPTNHRPDGPLTLMDKSMAFTALTVQRSINSKVLPVGTKIPLRDTHVKNTADRINSGDSRNRRVDYGALAADLSKLIGQEKITTRMLSMIKRNELDIFPRSRPLSFLAAGPSGVGKTETAKIFSKHLIDGRMIRINMSEFSEAHSVSRLIGSPPGYVGSTSDKEMPFDPVIANPKQIILLDEAEKAHPKVQKLFLSILDDGVLQMASGREIDFSKTIIIATTNSARDVTFAAARGGSFGFDSSDSSDRATARDGDGPDREKLIRALSKDFPTEFLGRFDWICAYNPIDRDDYATIVRNIYDRLREEISARRPSYGAHLPDLDDKLIESMVETSYVPEHGARPIEAVVRRHIGDLIEEALG